MEHFMVSELAGYRNELHYSHAVGTGALVFVSGITGVGPAGDVPAEVTTQFHDVFKFLGSYLRAAGLGYENLAEITTYHVHLRRHLDVFTTVKDEYLKAPYPAWTAIGVSELITPGALVEIRGVAVRS